MNDFVAEPQERWPETPSKPLYRTSTYQWGLGNILHRSDQSGEASSTKEQLSMKKKKKKKKKKESVKLKESAENAMTLPCSTCN